VSLCPPQILYGFEHGVEELATDYLSDFMVIHLVIQDLEHGEEEVNSF
jgi:hypothetical protein